MKTQQTSQIKNLIISLFLIILSYSTGFSQWINTGVESGFLNSIGISPVNSNFVMAGGDVKGGLYCSHNAGGNWQYTGHRAQSFLDFAFNPQDINIIFAGSSDGLFKSTDQGVSWTKTAFQDTMVFSLKYNPNNPNVIYAGTANQILDGHGSGILKSTDGGNHFTYLDLYPNVITRILVSKSDTSKILISSGSGVSLSTNSGADWSLFNLGIATASIAWNGGDTMYAGTMYEPGNINQQGTVFRSIDAGVSWDSLKAFQSSIEDIEIDPTNPDVVYVAVFESFNLKMGVWKSTDAGNTWLHKSNGIIDLMIKDIAIDPANPSTLYAVGDGGGGVYKSTDAGNNWNNINNGISNFFAYQTKYLHLENKDYIYSINSLGVHRNLPQIFRMDISTGIWQACGIMKVDTVPYDYTMFSIFDIAQDPNNTSTVFAVGVASSGGIFNHPNEGLFYKSTDGGLTWQFPIRFNYRSVNTVSVSYNGLQQIILVGTSGLSNDSLYGVYKSIDGGQNFLRALGPLNFLPVFDLQPDPFNASKIIAGTTAGIMRSSNFGDIWDELPAYYNQDSVKVAYRVLVDSTTQGRIFTANAGWIAPVDSSGKGGVSWSTDGWNTRKYGGLPKFNCLGLTLSANKIFAGIGGVTTKISLTHDVPGHGVLYAELGQNELVWLPLDTIGLEPKLIMSLTSFDSIIYAGTYGGGVWKYDLRQLLTKTQDQYFSESNLQVWPNPFNSVVTMSISRSSFPENTKAEIFISDIQGKTVTKFYTTINKLIDGISWDAEGLPNGLYSLKIIADNECFVKKLVLIK